MKDVVILKPGVGRNRAVKDAIDYDYCMTVKDIKRFFRGLDDETPVVMAGGDLEFRTVSDICITMYDEDKE